jgi:hypothetical protein
MEAGCFLLAPVLRHGAEYDERIREAALLEAPYVTTVRIIDEPSLG